MWRFDQDCIAILEIISSIDSALKVVIVIAGFNDSHDNAITQTERELAIIGGRVKFRMSKGLALPQSHLERSGRSKGLGVAAAPYDQGHYENEVI
ncbi:hypothetical protein Gotur_030518 [Gossypium turneri]